MKRLVMVALVAVALSAPFQVSPAVAGSVAEVGEGGLIPCRCACVTFPKWMGGGKLCICAC